MQRNGAPGVCQRESYSWKAVSHSCFCSGDLRREGEIIDRAVEEGDVCKTVRTLSLLRHQHVSFHHFVFKMRFVGLHN